MISADSRYEVLKEETQGRIFLERNFAKGWESIFVSPTELEEGLAHKGMRKITNPTLVLTSHSSSMAFVLASEESPVFICSKRTYKEPYGYTMLLEIHLGKLLPEYVYYLSKYEPWRKVSERIDYYDKLEDPNYEGWNWKPNVGCLFDPVYGSVEVGNQSIEEVFLGQWHKNIPTLSMQKQRISDAQSIEKHLQKKMFEKEQKFLEKEWLNEAHIRNSKHRLSNEVMPLRMAVENLRDFMLENPIAGIKPTDIIGKETGQTVDGLLEDLLTSIKNIEVGIDNLTKSEHMGESSEVIDVASFLNDYIGRKVSKYSQCVQVEKIGFERSLSINISHQAFIEVLDNIVNNAFRHGFTEERTDYILQFVIEPTNENMCKISIANNGAPMSERAHNTFFEQGSFAGPTGHTGIGGYIIYDICDKAHGRALPPYSKDGFPVVIGIEFPLV